MEDNHDKPGAARPNKRAALPEVIRLAREGLNCREIAEKVALSKTTVNRWLRAWRRKRAAKRAAESAQAIRNRIARYQVLADELIDAWRRFQADEQLRLIEKTGPVEDPAAAKEKRPVRSESRSADASYLAKAMEVEDRIEILRQRLAALGGNPPAVPGRRAISLANPSDEGFAAQEMRPQGTTEVLAFEAPPPETEPMAPAAAQGEPHTPCEEHRPAENPKKADPPRLTWQQQREILLHEAAEKKRKLKRYTDPKYCAYRWGQ